MIINFLATSMPHCKTILKLTLVFRGIIVTEPIRIKRGFFQGYTLSSLQFSHGLSPVSVLLNQINYSYNFADSSHTLSHLMYMDNIKLYASNKNHFSYLTDITQKFYYDICMQFGNNRLSVENGKIINNNYTLENGQNIESMNAASMYKYLLFNQQARQRQGKRQINRQQKSKKRLNKEIQTPCQYDTYILF